MEATTWIAADGTPVTIRAIRPEDFELERQFVRGLSADTGYMRLLSGRQLTNEEIERFVNVDERRETALVAIVQAQGREREVGVARFVRDEKRPGEAEFAIVLSDDWQGRGLGKRLLSVLIEFARTHGVRRMVGITLATNMGMLTLARRLGFSSRADPDDATVRRLTLDLD